MKELTTSQKKVLVAEFMSAVKMNLIYNEYEMYGIIPSIDDGENEQHFFTPEQMKFDSDWNWLMPVVEKIESLGYGVTIYRNGCHINDVKLFGVNGFNHKSKIEQTYKAVLEFIEWYKSKN